MDITFPELDLFCDGRILLASTRCAWRSEQDFDKNGIILDPATGKTTRILLGDGIADLSVDIDNRIWVSFFDEGVFGNFGWNRPGPPSPGAGGLVCFADDGTELWAFNSPENHIFIDDCYALNAQREERWAYFYSDFHVCSIDSTFRAEVSPRMPVSGARAFAVTDRAFLFSRQYGETSDNFHLVQRGGDNLEHYYPIFGQLAGRDWIQKCHLTGRGEWLHVVNDAGWFAANISDQLSDLNL